MKNIVCVIPARYASSRFPGKPLADICGKPMVWWVYQEAKKLADVCGVYVATESPLLMRECQEMGLDVILTADTHASGTDRVAEVARRLDADWYLVWMGDEPLIKAQEIAQLLSQARTKIGYEAYMLAKTFDNPVDVVNPTTIKLALNKHQELVFMSRSCIPFPKSALHYNYYKNIGAYLMSAEVLEFFAQTEVGDLEHIEEIELLRLLENHKKIFVCLLEDSLSMSVDTPKDLQRVVQLIESGANGDVAESKARCKHKFLSFGGGVNRYTLTRQKLESKGDSLSTSDSNLPENLAYRKDIYLERLDDALTPKILESRKDCSVCARSGGNGGLAPIGDTKFCYRKTCNKAMERVA
ncbi:MAG TPA: 3-deoxy-manno-octulosonate cytidylyltransferase [Candidatus Helicobacter avicola]|nr:3-deoxy-manno-octulosonate cytidylyltransferase [Candidatus Helicobacter avicola]